MTETNEAVIVEDANAKENIAKAAAGLGYDTGLPSKAPFMYIERKTGITPSDAGGELAVISYGAYNAGVVIAPEMGGVALVHEGRKFVLGTRTIPYKPLDREKVHRQLVDALKQAQTRYDVFCGMEACGGFDIRR